MKTQSSPFAWAAICLLILEYSLCLQSFAQGTAFTYQGQLIDSGTPANGTYDIRAGLYTNSTGGGTALYGPIANSGVAISNGLFTVQFDYGPVFDGTIYWMQVAVRTNGASTFTVLSPRQQLTPTPYAIFATAASNVTGVVSSGGLVGTYGSAVTLSNSANQFSGTFTGSGAGLTNVDAATLGGLSAAGFWQTTGNAGITSGFIGTTDNHPFDLYADNLRALRLILRTDASGDYSNAPNIIGGSPLNLVSSGVVGGTVGGGGGSDKLGTLYTNQVNANFGTVSGGLANTANGIFSTVAGGAGNTASSDYAATLGGSADVASGPLSTVIGGLFNVASGYTAVASGYKSTASGDYSFAAGSIALAKHDGSFVWADDSGPNMYSSSFTNGFFVRCTGGARIVTAIDGSGNPTAGVKLNAGDTAWSAISDRNAKKNFQPVNPVAVLDKLAAIPIEHWNYKWEADTNTPHLGPMAQDFKAAFYPGRDDKSISTLEFDGVELAAIQGLNQKLEADAKARDAEILDLKNRISQLEALVKNLAAHDSAIPNNR